MMIDTEQYSFQLILHSGGTEASCEAAAHHGQSGRRA